MEVANAEWVTENFVKEVRLEGQTFYEHRKSTLDRKNKRMHTTFTFIDRKTRCANCVETVIRLYDEPELKNLMANEDFEVVNVYSNVSREEFVPKTSKRILLVTRKRTIKH